MMRELFNKLLHEESLRLLSCVIPMHTALLGCRPLEMCLLLQCKEGVGNDLHHETITACCRLPHVPVLASPSQLGMIIACMLRLGKNCFLFSLLQPGGNFSNFIVLSMKFLSLVLLPKNPIFCSKESAITKKPTPCTVFWQAAQGT